MNKEYDWQKWIDSFDTNEDGRIIITEEENEEHMMKMRVVNKDHVNKFTTEYIDTLPKDKDGYLYFSPEVRAKHLIQMNWVSENYPNCRHLPFSEQDKIGVLASEAYKNIHDE